MSVTILVGDVREQLRTLPDNSVQMVCTSPPYFGLRSYLPEGHPDKAKEIGAEATPDAYVAEMVAVFREVRRVLRPDGVCFVNIGDSYAGSGRGGGGSYMAERRDRSWQGAADKTGWKSPPPGLKPKDRMMIPARVALGLQADGWWLRDEIVWHKKNPMPSSVSDRTTPAHEMVYLLTKSARYYWDAEAIAEPSCASGDRQQTRRAKEIADAAGLTAKHIDALRACGIGDAGKAQSTQVGYGRNDPAVQALADEAKAALGGYTREFLIAESRNRRSVWSISTEPYPGAHCAVMPQTLAADCIKAGSRQGDVVLDPFGGSGTTGLAASLLSREAILIELNPASAEEARIRLNAEAGLFGMVAE